MTREEEIILDLVMTGCRVIEQKTYWWIDHNCLSTYERATYYLWEKGILKKFRGGRIYHLSKKIKF